MLTYNKRDAKGNASYERILAANYQAINAWRDDPRHALPAHLFANAGLRPLDLYREFDSNVVPQMRLDEGDNILNPLMGLARPIPIARTILAYARSSDAGNFTQSMTGETFTAADKVDYDLGKTLIPVNQTPFKRNWREGEQLSQEGFDDAVHMQREHLRTHRQGVINSFMNGHKDKDGKLLKDDGVTWEGVRADSRVDQVDLSSAPAVDFTSPSLTGTDARAAFIVLAKRRMITNKVPAPATWFVSNEIFFNFARQYSDNYAAGSILQNLLSVPGVGSIVPSSVLTGNQVLSMVMSSTYVQPVVGMQVSTIAMPRPAYNSPFSFEIVSAVGWQVKTDFGDANTSIQYAAS